MFTSDSEILSQAEHAKMLAQIAAASKGKLTSVAVQGLLGATPAGRNRRQIREDVNQMTLSFPKAGA